MSASFIVVPQWQGSGSSRAMRLIEGAEAIGGDLPFSATTRVDVPSGAGSSMDTGVQRLSSVARVRDELAAVLRETASPAVVIGGDCGVELAAIDHAMQQGDVAVVWLDAHADLNTPVSSPSGAFHGMVLRTLLGDGADELVPTTPVPAHRVILAGTRALDEAENDFVEAAGITMLPPDALTADSLAEAVRETGASRVYIHVDLDVLDPAEFGCVSYPEPFGITLADLLALIGAVRDVAPLVGAGITEFAPASIDSAVDDLPSILRIVGALTRS
ncbi:arginase family protein [Marisediminicola sp. LYQ134]|uniref:arginase family protein n=1 Tax=unclassified Marisediminicola TaxID=2618316 RepID=UPI00398307DE